MDPRPSTLDDDSDEQFRAMDVLRTGLRQTPELKAGFAASMSFALVIALGKLIVPIAIQQILDKGVSSPGQGVRWSFIVTTCAIAMVAVVALAALNRITFYRLMTTAENVLYGLRTRGFAHVHELSVSDQNEAKRGVLVSRVTSDIETLAQFASYGAVSWVVNTTMIVVVAHRHGGLQLAARAGHAGRAGSRSSRSCGWCSGASSGPTTTCGPGSARPCPRSPRRWAASG